MASNLEIGIYSSHSGTSLVVQWLGLCAQFGGGAVSIPGWGTGSHMPQLRVHMLQLRSGAAKNKKKNSHPLT